MENDDDDEKTQQTLCIYAEQVILFPNLLSSC